MPIFFKKINLAKKFLTGIVPELPLDCRAESPGYFKKKPRSKNLHAKFDRCLAVTKIRNSTYNESFETELSFLLFYSRKSLKTTYKGKF